jgi:hypothetical protein
MARGKWVYSVAVLFVSAIWGSNASADEYYRLADPPPAPPVDMVVTREWYGSETLLFDGAAAMLWLGAVPASGVWEKTLTSFGSIGFLFGPFGVHLAHHRTGAAFGSLGLRLVFPVIGFAIGAKQATCELDRSEEAAFSGDCRVDATPAFTGALIGAAVASAIDASAIAYETHRTPRDLVTTGAMAPGLEVRSGGARLTLRGTF